MDQLRNHMSRLANFIEDYNWLSDSYMIEFFTNSHWEKLPLSWRMCLNDMCLEDFTRQVFGIQSLQSISANPGHKKIPLPLSLLAFVATVNSLSCSSETDFEAYVNENGNRLSQIPHVHHMFRRHVSLKKQHEIKQLGGIINKLCVKSNCSNVIDIGCGQGHLSRYLAFNYGLSVIAVEAVGSYIETAAKYVQDIGRDFDKLKNQAMTRVSDDTSTCDPTTPVDCTHPIDHTHPIGSVTHINQTVSLEEPPQLLLDNLLAQVKKVSAASDDSISGTESFVIVGLHACGDLSPSILKSFISNQRIVGLVSVGCCYMKLSCNDSNVNGYPMSHSVSSLKGHQLSYEARELACHSKTAYVNKLQDCDSEKLKIHCYRAAVEVIFCKHGLCRPHVKVSRSVSKLPFENYAEALLDSVGIKLTPENLETIKPLLTQWERVVMFFLLRQLIAPCVEAMILLDRVMYLMENGAHDVSIVPCFNPILSPRNLVITSIVKTS